MVNLSDLYALNIIDKESNQADFGQTYSKQPHRPNTNDIGGK